MARIGGESMILNPIIIGSTPKVVGVPVTVHGAVYEDITLSDGQTVTTGADGTGTAVVSTGALTLTGSVSGQSFTETVTEATTDIYCMPKGALYWYGNECIDVTGGWVQHIVESLSGFKTTNKINLDNTKKIFGIATKEGTDGTWTDISAWDSNNISYGTFGADAANRLGLLFEKGNSIENSFDKWSSGDSFSGEKYIYQTINQTGTNRTVEKRTNELYIRYDYNSSTTRRTTLHALWLE